MIGRSQEHLRALVSEVMSAARLKDKARTVVFVGDQYGNWKRTGSKTVRPMESVVLEEGLAERLYRDVTDFLRNEKYYAERCGAWLYARVRLCVCMFEGDWRVRWCLLRTRVCKLNALCRAPCFSKRHSLISCVAAFRIAVAISSMARRAAARPALYAHQQHLVNRLRHRISHNTRRA